MAMSPNVSRRSLGHATRPRQPVGLLVSRLIGGLNAAADQSKQPMTD
jgi:hypothetical protein